MTTTEQYLSSEIKYQREGYEMQANLQRYKVEQLIINASIEFAKRIKGVECLYSFDCFQEYLKALADTIANSDIDTAFMLPIIQKIKDEVFGRVQSNESKTMDKITDAKS